MNGDALNGAEEGPPIETSKNDKAARGKQVVGTLVTLAISAAFVWWVIRDMEDPREVLDHLSPAATWPLLVVFPLGVLSHVMRAQRWRRFIAEPVPLFYAFGSLMIGYAVNGIIPRGGEVARLVNMNRMTRVSFSQLMTTLLVERLLDVVVLFGLLGIGLLLEGERLREKFPEIMNLAPLFVLIVLVGVAVLGAMAAAPRQVLALTRRCTARLPRKVSRRLISLVEQAGLGLAFARSPLRLFQVTLETVAIWGSLLCCYVLALTAYGFFETLSWAGSTVFYGVTNLSVFVPTTGAIGAFHRFGQDALVKLYDKDPAISLAFVTILHLIAYYVIPMILGLVLWLAQPFYRRREPAR
jgi:glycosyltransferase 2 family protein